MIARGLKWLALASAAVAATAASAAPMLDQTSTPAGTTTLYNTQFDDLGGPFVGVVQQFTAGTDGTLSRIALGISGQGAATLNIYAGHGDPSFATPIYSQAITLASFQPALADFDWSTLPSWDVSAANLGVTAGEELDFSIVPADPNSASVWTRYNNGGFSYGGGESLFSLGYYAVDIGSTFAFQTYVGTPAAAVPEPATWSLMLVGFGAAGMALRSRNRLRMRNLAGEGPNSTGVLLN